MNANLRSELAREALVLAVNRFVYFLRVLSDYDRGKSAHVRYYRSLDVRAAVRLHRLIEETTCTPI